MSTAKIISPIQFNPEKRLTVSSSWAFNLDPIQSWAYWDNAFTKQECEKIIEIGSAKTLTQGRVRNEKKSNVRKSDIAWLYPSDGLEWAYEKMTNIITNLNDRFFGFDLFGIAEGLQFTRYESPGDRYGKHIDSSSGGLIRKLSFTLQLSEPETYKGGDLCLYFEDKAKVMKRDQGSITLFPSYVLHEVKPVTQGMRYSLVCWITGKPFK
jgi:PKHD-type hydroxylase